MEKLFERMEVEKLNYAVALNWYEEFKKATFKLQEMRDDNIIRSDNSWVGRDADRCYEDLNGFLWGLYTTGYISAELREEYTDQLLAMF